VARDTLFLRAPEGCDETDARCCPASRLIEKAVKAHPHLSSGIEIRLLPVAAARGPATTEPTVEGPFLVRQERGAARVFDCMRDILAVLARDYNIPSAAGVCQS
jgi:hypothetical protein